MTTELTIWDESPNMTVRRARLQELGWKPASGIARLTAGHICWTSPDGRYFSDEEALRWLASRETRQ
jgi:hypothetical protein